MSRLLFAAARGARIDVWYQCKWVSAIAVRTVDDLYNYRIHPDDAHLQYGPISTALREFAETGKELYALSGYAAVQMFKYECTYRFVLAADWPHAQMFALILAEFLADEGM